MLETLDEQGYALLPDFLDRETTAAIRRLTDRLAPPIEPAERPDIRRIHDLRHPIDDPLMARLATRPALLELGRTLLGTRSLSDLRLLEQVLIRTDPKPPPHGPVGWHVDWAFFPDECQATPRRTYFHLVHACSTVEPGGGAFLIVPGSHRQTYAATAHLSTEDELADFQRHAVERAGVDLRGAVEVCAREGDLIAFNPMAIHSASGNARARPRYVYFTSFFDASATRLRDGLRAISYRDRFPESLRTGLPESLRPLLER